MRKLRISNRTAVAKFSLFYDAVLCNTGIISPPEVRKQLSLESRKINALLYGVTVKKSPLKGP
jgi:hypothetical protein